MLIVSRGRVCSCICLKLGGAGKVLNCKGICMLLVENIWVFSRSSLVNVPWFVRRSDIFVLVYLLLLTWFQKHFLFVLFSAASFLLKSFLALLDSWLDSLRD